MGESPFLGVALFGQMRYSVRMKMNLRGGFAGCSLAILAACSAPDGNGSERMRPSAALRDDFGEVVAVGTAPQRIVSLDPTTTEILFAIGAGGQLVGRSQWATRPDSARFVKDVGPALRPNVEAVLAVHPDVVLLYASDDDRTAAAQLGAAGVRTIALRVDRVDQFRSVTRLLGRVTHEEQRATAVVDSVDRTLERIRTSARSGPRPRVFFYTWGSPLITTGGAHFLSELIEIAGGTNVFADDPKASVTVSLEELVRRDPDVILISPEGAAKIRRDPAWRTVRAVRNGRIAIYDTAVVGRAGVTLGAAAENFAGLLHPAGSH